MTPGNGKSLSQKGHSVAALVLSLEITQHLLHVHTTLSTTYSLSHAQGALTSAGTWRNTLGRGRAGTAVVDTCTEGCCAAPRPNLARGICNNCSGCYWDVVGVLLHFTGSELIYLLVTFLIITGAAITACTLLSSQLK